MMTNFEEAMRLASGKKRRSSFGSLSVVLIISTTLLAGAFCRVFAQDSVRLMSPQQMISLWNQENGVCRGSSVTIACGRRDAWYLLLNEAGWCLGKAGESGYQQRWHQCTTSSNIAPNIWFRNRYPVREYIDILLNRYKQSLAICEDEHKDFQIRGEACEAASVWVIASSP